MLDLYQVLELAGDALPRRGFLLVANPDGTVDIVTGHDGARNIVLYTVKAGESFESALLRVAETNLEERVADSIKRTTDEGALQAAHRMRLQMIRVGLAEARKSRTP